MLKENDEYILIELQVKSQCQKLSKWLLREGLKKLILHSCSEPSQPDRAFEKVVVYSVSGECHKRECKIKFLFLKKARVNYFAQKNCQLLITNNYN